MTLHINQCGEKLYEKLGFDVHKKDGFVFSQTYIQSPFLNGVIQCGENKDLENSFNEIHSHYQTLSLPYTWWVEDTSSNKELQSFLEKRGCQLLGIFPGMAHSLEHVPTQFKTNIQRAYSVNEFKEWSKVISEGFGMSDEIIDKYGALFQQPDDSFQHYICKEEGETMATGSILFSNGVGYIYNIATAKKHQGKGYASILTSELLRLAKARKCTQVVLQSSQAALSLYKKLGFEEKNAYKIYM